MRPDEFDEIPRRGGKRRFTILVKATKLDKHRRVQSSYTVAIRVWAKDFNEAKTVVRHLIEQRKSKLREINRKYGWVRHQIF